MVSLTRSKAVLELGKKLVAQLEGRQDLLASWMAHYIAQRIDAAAHAEPEERAAAEDACAKAVLDLWEYRSSIPTHLRPLPDLAAIQRTLGSLDVEETSFRYHPTTLGNAVTAEVDEETKKWLDLAVGIDYTARLLVRFALASAAEGAVNQAEPWVELARSAGAAADPEGLVVRLVREEEEHEKDTKQDADRLAKIAKLENFVLLASALAEHIRAKGGSESS